MKKKQMTVAKGRMKSMTKKKLIALIKDFSLCLDDLYKDCPQIAGSYFGAHLDSRIKDAILSKEGKTGGHNQ